MHYVAFLALSSVTSCWLDLPRSETKSPNSVAGRLTVLGQRDGRQSTALLRAQHLLHRHLQRPVFRALSTFRSFRHCVAFINVGILPQRPPEIRSPLAEFLVHRYSVLHQERKGCFWAVSSSVLSAASAAVRPSTCFSCLGRSTFAVLLECCPPEALFHRYLVLR
jgi:hypothetical protein